MERLSVWLSPRIGEDKRVIQEGGCTFDTTQLLASEEMNNETDVFRIGRSTPHEEDDEGYINTTGDLKTGLPNGDYYYSWVYNKSENTWTLTISKLFADKLVEENIIDAGSDVSFLIQPRSEGAGLIDNDNLQRKVAFVDYYTAYETVLMEEGS